MIRRDFGESFVRWQAITIGQLTYAINVILGFSVAALGFQVTLLLNEKFIPVSWQKCGFTMAIVFTLVSIVIGIFIVINRLLDFRETMHIARKRNAESNSKFIENLRRSNRNRGRVTWRLFWWQIGTFTIGILLTTLIVVENSLYKLL